MELKIIGKNFDIGEALRSHIEEKVNQFRQKYFDRTVHAHITLVKQRSVFHADCTLHLATGLILLAQGSSTDATQSFDQAAQHLEKQLKRYKQRLKHHQRSHTEEGPKSVLAATSYVIEADQNRQEQDEELPPEGAHPVIIAETALNIPELSVSDAVMALEISNVPFVMFKNKKGGAINIIYHRQDGNIGWLDPNLQKTG